MDSDLFRREARIHNICQAEESVLSLDNRFFRLSMLIILALIFLIAIYFIVGSYTQKQTVAGYVVAGKGLAKVHAPYSATVLERYVSAGETVAVNEPLYRLEMRQSTLQAQDVGEQELAVLERRREVLSAQKAQTKRAARLEQTGIEARLPVVEDQLAALRRELATRREALALHASGMARLEKMLATGVVSRSAYEKKQAQFLERKAAVAALERSVLDLEARLADLKNQREVVRIRNANRLADYDKELAILEQEILRVSSRSQAVVRAPVSGMATGVVYEPGQYVTPQVSLLTLLPEGGELQARLLVPSRAIGFIEPGQQVNLRYRAFPYQQYGTYAGTVLRVSRSAVTPGSADLPVAIQAPVYVVTVDLARQSIRAYGREYPLQAGMMLEADIVTGEMQLYEWLLQPLYRLQGTL